jgi:hypothetical protein
MLAVADVCVFTRMLLNKYILSYLILSLNLLLTSHYMIEWGAYGVTTTSPPNGGYRPGVQKFTPNPLSPVSTRLKLVAYTIDILTFLNLGQVL